MQRAVAASLPLASRATPPSVVTVPSPDRPLLVPRSLEMRPLYWAYGARRPLSADP